VSTRLVALPTPWIGFSGSPILGELPCGALPFKPAFVVRSGPAFVGHSQQDYTADADEHAGTHAAYEDQRCECRLQNDSPPLCRHDSIK